MKNLTAEQIEAINQIDTNLKIEIDKLDKSKMSDAQTAIKLAVQAKKAKNEISKNG